MTKKVQWLLCGMGDELSHKTIGRTLGSDEVSDIERVASKAIDRQYDAWDGDGFSFEFLRNIYIELRKQGLPAGLYKRTVEGTDRGEPERWEEDAYTKKALAPKKKRATARALEVKRRKAKAKTA